MHTSVRESLCMAIIEAMASGLGVVAAIGGIPELFEPGFRRASSGRSTIRNLRR